MDAIVAEREQQQQITTAKAKNLIQAAFSNGVISRDNARMYAKIMFGDYYYKFHGTENYCSQDMLMPENQALRIEYLTLTNEMWNIAKLHRGTQFYDEETRKWIKGRLSVAKTYLGIEKGEQTA